MFNVCITIIYLTGVTNMTAIGNVISWQKVDYDFNFHQQEFTTNIVALVLSEGKSILKVFIYDFCSYFP